MKTRIISAAVLIAIVGVCFFASPVTRALFMLAAAVLGIRETANAVKVKDINCTPWILYIFAASEAAAIYFKADALIIEALFVLAVFALLSAGVCSKNVRAPGALAGLAVLVYPAVPFLLILRLALSDNWVPVFVIGCVCTWVCDSFALFGGMLLGKHKLCPEVSPKKTIEGSVSGAVFAVIAGIVIYFILKGSYELSLLGCALTALICTSFGQMGDLAASLIKRWAGIKDYSKLIPGHGGVMDRMDSLLFAIPVAYFCLSLNIL